VRHRVTLIPGDGIGPEVSAAARSVVEATGVHIDWEIQEAGAGVMEREGTPLPDHVIEAIQDTRTAIKGPITTPVGTGFRSVNVALRQDLDLFAAVRPARHFPGVPTRHPGVDLVVIRENTEDLYQGVEFEQGSRETALLRQFLRQLRGYELPKDAGVTLKPISVSGTERIVRFGLEFARQHNRKHVTIGHKANIMKFSDGVFLATAWAVSQEFPDVDVRELQIDEMAMRLAWEPESMDVLLLPNLYGDIMSDLCAGLVGGLGLVPGANLGWEYAMFEPVHGSAPDIAGKGVANPLAMILTAAMMLRHLAEEAAAASVEAAVGRVLERGEVLTPDMGGSASTDDVAHAVAQSLE
jgi:isocitrate dehydrogenase (NAD+)